MFTELITVKKNVCYEKSIKTKKEKERQGMNYGCFPFEKNS